MATAAPGPTGDYTTPVERGRLTEWVQRAGEADTYVMLDLQPGTQDFLTQARAEHRLRVVNGMDVLLDDLREQVDYLERLEAPMPLEAPVTTTCLVASAPAGGSAGHQLLRRAEPTLE